jgi:hypothetical protein
MDKVTIRIFHDEFLSGRRNRLGFAKGYPKYFSWIPPRNRKITGEFVCPVGGERCRDFWYSHDTGKAGDVKLCRIHQVIEEYDSRVPNLGDL